MPCCFHSNQTRALRWLQFKGTQLDSIYVTLRQAGETCTVQNVRCCMRSLTAHRIFSRRTARHLSLAASPRPRLISIRRKVSMRSNSLTAAASRSASWSSIWTTDAFHKRRQTSFDGQRGLLRGSHPLLCGEAFSLLTIESPAQREGCRPRLVILKKAPNAIQVIQGSRHLDNLPLQTP